MKAYVCKPSLQEAVGTSQWIPSQPEVESKTLSQNNRKISKGHDVMCSAIIHSAHLSLEIKTIRSYDAYMIGLMWNCAMWQRNQRGLMKCDGVANEWTMP